MSDKYPERSEGEVIPEPLSPAGWSGVLAVAVKRASVAAIGGGGGDAGSIPRTAGLERIRDRNGIPGTSSGLTPDELDKWLETPVEGADAPRGWVVDYSPGS